jgi:outer membrane protein assembly factor BamB
MLSRLALILVCHCSLVATDWPRFLGPDGRSRSDASLVQTWSEQQNLQWTTPLPGPGSSSPVVFGDRIYVTCWTGYGVDSDAPADLRYHLLCLDAATGAVQWDREQEPLADTAFYKGFVKDHGFASATPVVDEQAVYTFFETTGVQAWSHAGEPLWRTSIGTGSHHWGHGTSPVRWQNLVIVNASIEADAVIAVDAATGNEIWRTTDVSKSWTTPTVAGEVVLISAKGLVRALDAATGAERWRAAGIDDYVCSTIQVMDQVAYAIGSRRGKAVAIRLGGSGDVSESHVLWRCDLGSNVPSPVYHDGKLFWTHEKKGEVYCVDASTGELLGEQHLKGKKRAAIYATPLINAGRLILPSRDQGTWVLSADAEMQILAHNVIAGDESRFDASPAVAGDRLLLRSEQALYAIASP